MILDARVRVLIGTGPTPIANREKFAVGVRAGSHSFHVREMKSAAG